MKSISSIMLLAFITLMFLFARNVEAEITIENHKDNSVVRYPVILLRGTKAGAESKIFVKNLNSAKNQSAIDPVVYKRKFKILVRLEPGLNEIEIKEQGSDTSKKISVEYKQQSNPYYVRIVWMTDSSGDTSYATPTDKESQNYEDRLRTAAQLMQTFTAERMHDLGYGRKTFRLERDSKGKIVVHTFQQPKKAEYYYGLKSDQVWYREVYRWLNKEHPDQYAKNIVLAAYTRKDSKTGKMKSHTALGGGNLGLFGSGSVFSWPADLSTAVETFEDARMVDPKRVHEDSAGRGTYWAVASTTIGATLHEMGHTFGLPHCTDRFGIMTRGFDHFHRVFTFHDPPMKRAALRRFTRKEEAYFAPVSASFLQWSPWFRMDKREHNDTKRPTISYDKTKKQVVIKSNSGVPWLGVWNGDRIHSFREFKQNPKTIELSIDEINEILGGKTATKIGVISCDGMSNRFAIPSGS